MGKYEDREATDKLLRDSFAYGVGLHMGEGWSGGPNEHHSAVLTGPSGEKILLRAAWENPKMIEISGILHHLHSDVRTAGLTPGSIRVTLSRGATTVAEEIKRRLLPEYGVALEKMKTRVAEHKMTMELRATTVALIEEILGQKATTVGNNDATFYFRGSPAGSLWVNSQGYLTLDLRGYYDDLDQVLKALGGVL